MTSKPVVGRESNQDTQQSHLVSLTLKYIQNKNKKIYELY